MRLAQGLAIKPDEALALAVFGTITSACLRTDQVRPVFGGKQPPASMPFSRPITVLTSARLSMYLRAAFSRGAILPEPALALIASVFVLLMLLLGMIAMYTNRKPAAEMQQAAARGNMLIGSAIDAADTVRAFNAGNFRQAWQNHIRHAHDLFHKVATSRGMMQSLNQTFVALTTVCIIGVGSTYVAAELDTVRLSARIFWRRGRL